MKHSGNRRITVLLAALLMGGAGAALQAQNVRPGLVSSPEERQKDTVVRPPMVDSSLVGISIYRLLQEKSEAPAVVRRDAAVDRALEKQIVRNADRKRNGFRIRIFFDNKQDARLRSEEIESSFSEHFPLIPVYRSYTNPYFKVTVGDFRTKSDALRVLKRIQEHYPSAFVVKDKIQFPAVISSSTIYSSSAGPTI